MDSKKSMEERLQKLEASLQIRAQAMVPTGDDREVEAAAETLEFMESEAERVEKAEAKRKEMVTDH